MMVNDAELMVIIDDYTNALVNVYVTMERSTML
jgi:hypothetical protein